MSDKRQVRASGSDLPEPKRVVIDAEEFADEEILEVPIAQLRDGTLRVVRVKQLDLLTMLWDGSIPEPMLAAAHDLLEVGQENGQRELKEMSQGERQDMLSMLRRYACSACIEPVFVLSEADGGPKVPGKGECPVTRLTTQQLLMIYYATPGTGGVRLTMERARDFCETGTSPADSAAPSGDSVRTATERLDHQRSSTYEAPAGNRVSVG